VQSIYPQIAGLPARVVAVSFSPPERVAFFLSDTQLSFPVLSDAPLDGYHAFGLTRVSWLRILRPDVIWRFTRMMFRGWLPKKPAKGDDVLQLGGDFVIDAEGILRWAHRSSEPTDRPAKTAMLDALEQAIRTN
jgi:peroxiredoxin